MEHVIPAKAGIQQRPPDDEDVRQGHLDRLALDGLRIQAAGLVDIPER
jgi:hypothetical protein